MVLPAHSHAGRHWPASAAAIVASGLALPKLTGRQRQEALARPRTFDVAHEIADDLDLIGVIGRDFHVGELIFDQDQQFQAVEPSARDRDGSALRP